MIKIAKNEDIIRFFYEEHKRPTDIAEELKVSKPYITKIIQKDEKYIKEKEYRSNISKENHKACKRNYINKRRQTEKQEYQAMIIQINKDNEYLSTQIQISDLDCLKKSGLEIKEIKEYMYKICFEVVQGIFFCHIFFVLIIVLKRKWVRILKKGLKITFINPNTEEQIVQAMAGVLAYNLAENDDGVTFDYKTTNSYQNSHGEIGVELEM